MAAELNHVRLWGDVRTEDEHGDLLTEIGWSRRALDRWWLVVTAEVTHTADDPWQDFFGNIVFLGTNDCSHYELDDEILVCRYLRTARDLVTLAEQRYRCPWFPLGFGDMLRLEDTTISAGEWKPRREESRKFYAWRRELLRADRVRALKSATRRDRKRVEHINRLLTRTPDLPAPSP